MKKHLLLIVLLFSIAFDSMFAEGTKLLRYPSTNGQLVAFVYAGDLWIVGHDGGEARRLTSSQRIETSPFFSPDGRFITFTGNYSGNNEVYLIGTSGGEPLRLTWHPSSNNAVGWTPDGEKILFSSSRFSQPIGNLDFFLVSVEGGIPETLPIHGAIRASYSGRGNLLAYENTKWQTEWKWYRGGQAKPIRIVSFPGLDQKEVPGPVCMNSFPSFIGDLLYFLSDRDGTFNIFSYDISSETVNQVTHSAGSDIKSLSAGGGLLTYEIDGVIHVLDPKTGLDKELSIKVNGDFPWAIPHWTDVSKNIVSASLSPNGARALFEARGDIFTVPALNGDVHNITHSPGAADRSPSWSPDGQKIAWFSDMSGEYKLMISDQDGLTSPKEISIDKPTFFYNLSWSPDSRNLAFTNSARQILLANLEKQTIQCLDTDLMASPERTMIPVWSPDSKWIAYSKQLRNKFHAIKVYSITSSKSYQITDGLSDAVNPAWDREGKYLFFLASTDIGLNTGWLDLSSYERVQHRNVYFAVLSKDFPSPLLPLNDQEKYQSASKEKKKETSVIDKKSMPLKNEVDTLNIKIDIDGIGNRILSLPLSARNYIDLHPGNKGVLFITEQDLPFYPEHPSGPEITIHRWNMARQKDTIFLSNKSLFNISANGNKIIYKQKDDWYIIASDIDQKPGEGKLNMDLKMKIDPIAEWKQIYREAWRFFRDYFYVPNYHGTDWNKVYEKYLVLLPYVRHRDDLNYILDMMGGELAVGHHFVGGGDYGDQVKTNIGLLGADISLENGHYRIKRILTGENWNPDLRAPLAAPGIEVHEGDYILAVNGVALLPPITPEASLEGYSGKQVTLLINSSPTTASAHSIKVVPIDNEASLRSRAWVENNRRYVDKLSQGTLAYVWLPDTYSGGYTYFNRYYFGQQDRQGAILDERFNGGGDIADYIIDILNRKLRGYFNNPVGKRDPWTEPLAGIWGSKVMIINEYAGSGGDMMPYMFRQSQIGPLIGEKTWGGLVGIWDYPDLIDGGYVTVPRGGFFNLDGQWDVENKGILPDISVDVTPKDIASGIDPQLDQAIEEAMRLLKNNPVKLLKEPLPPVKNVNHLY
jgi:tricorn protease